MQKAPKKRIYNAANTRGTSGLLLLVAMDAVNRNVNVVQQFIMKPALDCKGLGHIEVVKAWHSLVLDTCVVFV